MSRTHKQTKMRELKHEIQELRERVGEEQLARELSAEFWQRGSLRYGNNRKSIAKDKVILRRKERHRDKARFDDEI